MKALSLLGVFVLAKVLVLAGRSLDWNLWTLFAYLWQDVLVVVLFAGLEAATPKRQWINTMVYGLLVAYTALNVPLACVLSTPMTWPMLKATRGTLADSILHYVTWVNVLRITLVVAAGVALPLWLRRWRKRVTLRLKIAAAVVAPLIIVLGPYAVTQVDTIGLHRNPVVALVSTALPRVSAADHIADWRVSPFGNPLQEDLTALSGQAAGRNVVVIHLESAGARYLRTYGAAEDPMPNLTSLARQALVFENAYTVYPETIKSFFAVQCSFYPAMDTAAEAYERVASPGFASLLRQAGYRTGLFHSGRFNYLGMDAVIRNRGYELLEDAGAIGGDRESSFGIDEGSTVRRMLGWIDTLPRNQPFLLSYLPIAGHHPYDTPLPPTFLPEEHEINRYRNALRYADTALGDLVQGLRQRGHYENTVFVIFGDHGEAFGQHKGNYGHTLFIWEENIRIPFLIVAPGLIHKEERIQRVATLVDVAPTILDLTGQPIPKVYQGRSLLDPQSGMALFCTDYTLGLLGLRDGRWKLIHELESGRSKLFDLAADPEERRDLSGEHPERVEEYRDHLLRWSAGQKHRVIR